MAKKLFKLFQDAAMRPDDKAPTPPQAEEAAYAGNRMRELIKSQFGSEHVAVLRQVAHGGEAAAKPSDQLPAVDDVIDPTTDMLRAITEESGLRMINLRTYPKAEFSLRSLISSEQAKSLRVAPVEELEDGTVVVAIADPSNPTIGDDLRLILGREVETVIAEEEEILERIEQYYGMGDETIEDLIDQEDEDLADENVLTVNEAEVDLSDLETLANAPPIIKLVNLLLLKAINERASDIHIEPFHNFIRVRYRVDGVLREMPSPPRSQLLAIVSRMKVMAGLNISETRKPQDGRIKAVVEGREIDMRVSSMPTVHGEAVVMRVLDKSMMMIGISQIGMMGDVLEGFKNLIRRPNGIVLVTGPTGCGKTTTLYSALAEVRDPGEKLITTEDPVEYELDGIQQVNINEGVGLTFARCLRSILRQDPDTVLVGEIRDVETAQIAVQASLTGHLVFSTLHTNSAAATVTRLLDMGVEPFLITSSLEGIIGQRLVRNICQSCKSEYMPGEEELFEFGASVEDVKEQGITFFQGTGCNECLHTGYHGRMGIFELLLFNDDVRELVLERATTDEVHEMAVRDGMKTMREDGWVKACMGLTTLREVARQTPTEAEQIRTTSKTIAAEERKDELEEPKAQKALPEGRPRPSQQVMSDKEEATRPGED